MPARTSSGLIASHLLTSGFHTNATPALFFLSFVRNSRARQMATEQSSSRCGARNDVGKAHLAFQLAMRDAPQLRDATPDKLWAKSGGKGKPNYRMPNGTKRNGFRHELASALAWLVHHGAETDANLIAFLIAAHHGKVRGSIRSLPNETRPTDETIKFARGVWDGDDLPSVDLGNGEVVPATKLTLGLMDLGEGEFGPSWLARVLAIRDELGPFRLSYLETLLRIADWRGSKAGEKTQ